MTDRQISSRPIDESASPAERLRPLGLKRNPFAGSGPLVTSPQQQAPLEALRTWMGDMAAHSSRPDRLAVLTAPAGRGKSRILRHLAASSGAAAPLIDPGKSGLTDAQLLRAMVDAFGGTATGRTGMELRRDIRLALADLPKEIVPGLLIDDADFTGARLELIRNVLRDGAEHGLWIILAGQPDLADRVARRRSMKALLGPVARIEPSDASALRTMLVSRLESVVSPGRAAMLLPAETVDAIVDGAAGNPGRLFRIAEVALETAARQGVSVVSRSAVLAASHGLEAVAETLDAASGPRVVQVEIPLLANGAASRQTTQRSLWDGEGS